MRVTGNTFTANLVDQLGLLASKQNRLQNQAVTGQRIQFPEDDPSAMRRVLDWQSEVKSLAQYKRNISRQQELASASFEATKGLKKISDRAGEIALSADGTKSPQQLAILSNEVNDLIGQALQLANGKHGPDYLFAGTRNDQSPFLTTQSPNGQIATVAYRGNTNVAEIEIAAGVTLSAQTLGANSTGQGQRGLITDSRTGADFFRHLIALRDQLQTQDLDSIANVTRPDLARDEENFIFHFAANGALQSRLETAASLTAGRSFSVETMVSQEADVDLAQTLVQLNETQVAYRAALQSGANILGRSLLDFLR